MATVIKKYRLSVLTAAELMGVSAQFVRVGLQRGILPFGYAIKLRDKNYTYYISPFRFTEYTGIPITFDQLEQVEDEETV